MEPLAIKIEYWTLPDGSPSGMEPEGIDEFRNELQEHYVSLVRGHSGACGGGLYDLIVHITSSITLRDVASAILRLLIKSMLNFPCKNCIVLSRVCPISSIWIFCLDYDCHK